MNVATLAKRIGPAWIAEQGHEGLYALASEAERFEGHLPEEYDPSFEFTVDDIAYLAARALVRHMCLDNGATEAFETFVFGVLTCGG